MMRSRLLRRCTNVRVSRSPATTYRSYVVASFNPTLHSKNTVNTTHTTKTHFWSGNHTGLKPSAMNNPLLVRGYASYPSHEKVGLPALSPTMEKGNLVKWVKQEGEEISAGEVIAEVETDKAVIPWEAQDDTFLAKILVPEGTNDIVCGTPVAIFVEDEDDIAVFADYTLEGDSGGSSTEAPKEAPKIEEAKREAEQEQPKHSQQAPQEAVPSPSGGRVMASPYARKVAADQGVNVATVPGSGPGGRIIAADVVKAASSAPASFAKVPQPFVSAGQSYEDIPASQIRKVTAQRLLESKQTIPHYYLTVDCNIDKLLELRKQLNEGGEKEGFKLSLNDFVIKASALALKKVPECNSSWQGDFIRRFHNVDINVAVNTDQGLFTPIVASADHKGLATINGDVKALAQKAKENKLAPEEFMGGTFTISNLGMFGIKSFSAVINPPQSCILAVGGTEQRVVKKGGDEFGVSNYMSVTLSCDHRVVDGAVGAQWLKAFRSYLEEPLTMLL